MPIPSPKVCQICSKPLTMHEQFAGNICGDWRCRWRTLDGQLEAYRNDAAMAVGEPSARSFPISVVPFHTRPAVPVSQLEREELRAFLEKLREEISSRENGTQVVPPQVSTERSVDTEAPNANLAALLGSVCGVCEGFCCRYGAASHAFLDEETLLRVLVQHPGMQVSETVLAYVHHIPPEHYQESCIYHARTGCSLPRDMRARICNTYECKGLTETREHFAKTHANRVFVVVRHDNRIMRSAFVEESRMRQYPTETAATPDTETQGEHGSRG